MHISARYVDFWTDYSGRVLTIREGGVATMQIKQLIFCSRRAATSRPFPVNVSTLIICRCGGASHFLPSALFTARDFLSFLRRRLEWVCIFEIDECERLVFGRVCSYNNKRLRWWWWWWCWQHLYLKLDDAADEKWIKASLVAWLAETRLAPLERRRHLSRRYPLFSRETVIFCSFCGRAPESEREMQIMERELLHTRAF